MVSARGVVSDGHLYVHHRSADAAISSRERRDADAAGHCVSDDGFPRSE